MKFHERLKELRNEKGIKQKELAKELNISTSAVGKYETNKRTPNEELLNKIADFFSVSCEYLLGKSDKRLPYSTAWYEDQDELINQLKLSREEKIRLQETGLIELLDEKLENKIPKISDVRNILENSPHHSNNDYTDNELKKLLNKYYGTSTINQINAEDILKRHLKKIKENKERLIPVVNLIESYDNVIKQKYIINYEKLPNGYNQNKNYIYLKADDDTMSHHRIHKGDLVLIEKDKNLEINDDDIILVFIEEEKKACLRLAKYFKPDYGEFNDFIILISKNSINVIDIRDIKVIGKALEVKFKL